MGAVKEAAMKIIEDLDDDATWDDLLYKFYVNKKVADGEAAADEGQVVSHSEARKKVAKR